MTDGVEAFRQIGQLIFKWIFIAASVVVGAVILIIGVVYVANWYSYDRHVDKVQFIINTDRKECPDDKYPIHIIIGNGAGRTLERVTFTLSAHQPGRSTDLTEYNSYTDDHISQPKEGYGACWSAPRLTDPFPDLRTLQWSIKYKTLYFRD